MVCVTVFTPNLHPGDNVVPLCHYPPVAYDVLSRLSFITSPLTVHRNYKSKLLELSRYFADEVLSVALHPSGLHVLLGFSDKLRMMNVLIDDIRQHQEYPVRACRECRFSHGGHLFAAASGVQSCSLVAVVVLLVVVV